MKKFLLASVLLASCAHQLKSVDDLQINASYPMVNAKPEYAACELKAQNVATAVPTPQGLILPIELLKGTKAYVCGSVDCSKAKGKEKEGTDWYCGPVELLISPDQSSKSE